MHLSWKILFYSSQMRNRSFENIVPYKNGYFNDFLLLSHWRSWKTDIAIDWRKTSSSTFCSHQIIYNYILFVQTTLFHHTLMPDYQSADLFHLALYLLMIVLRGAKQNFWCQTKFRTSSPKFCYRCPNLFDFLHNIRKDKQIWDEWTVKVWSKFHSI